MKKLFLGLVLCLLFIVATGANADSGPWPVNGWAVSTPEEQGMDSGKLMGMFQYRKALNLNINSALIVRHGHLVMEAYLYPYNRFYNKHHMHSVTKSFTSTLIGLAIEDGAIEDVHQPITQYFPGLISNRNSLKSQITLENLLTMTSGLDWDEHYIATTDSRGALAQMVSTNDWLGFVLNLPMKTTPGSEFNYNTGVSHLLSAILQKATGKNAFDYAKKRLFEPLGITDVSWGSDPQGITTGGFGLFLKPTDMAKFGYLFLKEGQWNGKQLIPADWVRTATAKHVDNTNFSDWGTYCSAGYGYQWWRNPFGGYSAQGHAGQYIIVIPQSDLVIVFTSDLPDEQVHAPLRMVEQFILPSIQSEKAIKPNPKAAAALRAYTRELESHINK